MFFVGNLFIQVGRLVDMAAMLYSLVVIAAAVITWLPVDPYHPAARLLRQMTEPVYERVKKYLPRGVWDNAAGVDFTPWIVLIAVWFLGGLAANSLVDLGTRLR